MGENCLGVKRKLFKEFSLTLFVVGMNEGETKENPCLPSDLMADMQRLDGHKGWWIRSATVKSLTNKSSKWVLGQLRALLCIVTLHVSTDRP